VRIEAPNKYRRTLIDRITANAHRYMAVPALLLFAVFFLYPLIRSIGLSLTDWNGISAARFVGIRNFISFFSDPRALADVKNTVLFAVGSAPLLNLFGLIYALILDRSFAGKGVVRAVIYLPAVISPLIMGYIWYLLIQPERGLLFQTLHQIGLSVAGNWLDRPDTAMAVVVIVNVWQFVGMTMVIFLAGLQTIPQELYEASTVEGAGYFATLRYVTIPLLAPAIRINVITNIIGSLSVFDIIVSLTDGGPGYSTESLSIYILRMVYGSQTGYSTAVALVLFIIILIPVAIALRLMRRTQYEV